VGVTGIVNTWADVLLKVWQHDQLAEMTAAYQGQPRVERPGSLEAAVRAAVAQEPEKAPEKFQAFIQQGLDVVNRIKLWPEGS
jgi:hypothetical protein